MIALAVVAQLAIGGQVSDAGSGAPIGGASVRAPAASATTGDDGRFRLVARIGDTLSIRRIGYRPHRFVVDDTTVVIRMTPSAVRLGVVAVQGADRSGPTAVTRDTRVSRNAGATDVSEAVASMPFIAARAVRGRTTVSMRGARPEQVAATFDGLLLTDPATGVVDLGDLPLSAVASISALPGDASAEFGSGASGGVIALSPAREPVVAAHAGSHGTIGAEAGAPMRMGGAFVLAAASWMSSRNDYEFVNAFADPDSVERRRNANERSASLFLNATSSRASLVLLGTESERGLPGTVNVRAYDNARELTRRFMGRGAISLGRGTLALGGRAFGVHYDDASYPAFASYTRAVALDADVSIPMSSIDLRAGAGHDHVLGTRFRSDGRARAFTALGWSRTRGRLRMVAAGRVDWVEDHRAQLSPTIGVEFGENISVFGRAGRGFRIPTFYDLRLASPQQIAYEPVAPERVRADVEAGVRTRTRFVRATLAAYARDTRDAIVWVPGNFSWSPRNLPLERVRGVESRVALGGNGRELELWGMSQRAELVLDVGDVPVPYVPRSAGGAVARMSVGPWHGTATIVAIGRRPFVIALADRDAELHGDASLDLAIARDVDARARSRIVVAVHDAMNARIETTRLMPSPGRRWSLSLTHHPRIQ